MRDFRKRIGLIHKLGKLAAAEKLLNGGHDGLRVDQIMRQRLLQVEQVHPLLDRPLHANQTDPELILK